MNFKKILITLLCSAILLISWATGAHAVTFKDQSDIDNLPWAKEAIQTMAEKGIITGMPDGTFKPADSIKKLDSLILMAKVLGSNEPENQAEVSAAEERYKTYLNNYLVYGKKEISYLLDKGIIKTNELDDYIGSSSAYSTMLRYEAAILLVKVMGQEEKVNSSTIIVLPFADQGMIPERARPYIDYLYKEDIMKGISTTEFGPFLPITRAQMALLLYKSSQHIAEEEESEIEGVISKVETDLNLVWIVPEDDDEAQSYSLSGAAIKIEGKTKKIADLRLEMPVTLTLKGSKVIRLEAENPEISLTVRGVVTSASTSKDIRKIKVEVETDDEDETETETYEIKPTVLVYDEDGDKTSHTSISKNDYVTIHFVNDEIYKVTFEKKEKKVSGFVKAVKTDLPATITIEDEDDEEEYTYTILSDVSVKRNKKSASVRDIRTGDEVSITLNYNKVKEITASGDRTDIEGSIEEMVISRTPRITIKNEDGDLEKFNVALDTKVIIDGEEKSFYDLRVGADVELELESETVVSIASVASKEIKQFTGTINEINLNIGVVTIKPEGNASEIKQLYFPRNTSIKVTNAVTGEIGKTKDLEKGQKIIAFGYSELGVFIVNQITIISE